MSKRHDLFTHTVSDEVGEQGNVYLSCTFFCYVFMESKRDDDLDSHVMRYVTHGLVLSPPHCLSELCVYITTNKL